MHVDILEEEDLPCGCHIGRAMIDGKKTMFIKPCSDTCKYYAYTITESRKEGKPIEMREEL